MLISIHVLTSLLAFRAVEGSVLAERHTAIPIHLQFSVPGSVFSALSNGNFLSNYLRKETQSGSNRGQSYNNLNIKQLAQGFFVIDRFLSQGPDAAARIGATFSGGPGEGKVPSTSPGNNNPDDDSIYSEHTVIGAAGPNSADDPSLSTDGVAIGLAAYAGGVLYGPRLSRRGGAGCDSPDPGATNPDPRRQAAAESFCVNADPQTPLSQTADCYVDSPDLVKPTTGPVIVTTAQVSGVEDGPYTVRGQRSDDLLLLANCVAGATGAKATSTFSTTLVWPINNPSANKTFGYDGCSTCMAGVSSRNGGVPFYEGRSTSRVQGAPDYLPEGGVKAVVSCNGMSAPQQKSKVVYTIKIKGIFTRAKGFVGALTVKKTSSVAASCK